MRLTSFLCRQLGELILADSKESTDGVPLRPLRSSLSQADDDDFGGAEGSSLLPHDTRTPHEERHSLARSPTDVVFVRHSFDSGDDGCKPISSLEEEEGLPPSETSERRTRSFDRLDRRANGGQSTAEQAGVILVRCRVCEGRELNADVYPRLLRVFTTSSLSSHSFSSLFFPPLSFTSSRPLGHPYLRYRELFRRQTQPFRHPRRFPPSRTTMRSCTRTAQEPRPLLLRTLSGLSLGEPSRSSLVRRGSLTKP